MSPLRATDASGSGGGGGGGDEPLDILIDETVEVGDTLTISLPLADSLTTSEALQTLDLDMADSVATEESLYYGDLQGTIDESVSTGDTWNASLDVDAYGDHYLDESNPTTNYGTATGLLAKEPSLAANDEKITYIWWDFRNFSGVTNTADGIFHFHVSQTDPLIAKTFRYAIYHRPSLQHDEANDDWSNEPYTGTAYTTNQPVSVTAGAAVWRQITVPKSVMDTIMGKVVWFRFTGDTGLLGDLVTFTFSSRESANAPYAELELKEN